MTGEMTVRFEFELDDEDSKMLEESINGNGTMTAYDLDWSYYMNKAMYADLEEIEVG